MSSARGRLREDKAGACADHSGDFLDSLQRLARAQRAKDLAQALPRVSSPAQTEEPSAFRRRRLQNWVFLGLMYGFFYMSRYNFSAVQAAVAEQFGWSHADYGSVLSAGLLTYGCAVFFNGPIADRIGGKRAILIGAAGAAVFNVLFGLCHLLLLKPARVIGGQVVVRAELAAGMSYATVIAMFAVLWACNHYFQSFGALSIVKINAAWFRVSERGKFAGVFGIMIQAGRTLAFTVLPVSLRFLPWQYAFFIPAAFLIVMWFVCLNRVENTPAAAGLGELDTGDESAHERQAEATLGFILRKVFARRAPWIIALASMCIGLVRHSVDHWYPRYIGVMFGIPAKSLFGFAPYNFASVAMPLAAILGGLCAGNASDRLFSSRRAPVICLAFVGQALCLGLLRGTIGNAWGASLALVLISFFVQSAHSLVGGAASMDFGGRKAVATAAGFFDGAQYLAGSIVGWGMGRILERYQVVGHPGVEFAVWPLLPLGSAILGALIISRLWHALPGRRAPAPAQPRLAGALVDSGQPAGRATQRALAALQTAGLGGGEPGPAASATAGSAKRWRPCAECRGCPGRCRDCRHHAVGFSACPTCNDTRQCASCGGKGVELCEGSDGPEIPF